MSLLEAFSWPYSEGKPETLTREFFEKLREGMAKGKSFPYLSNHHQISLVTSQSGTWFVAIMVITNNMTDDSVQIMSVLKAWFKECECGPYDDYESVGIRGNSIESSLGSRYTIIETLNTKETNISGHAAAIPVHPPAIPVKSASTPLPPPIPVKPPPLPPLSREKGEFRFYVRTSYIASLDITAHIWFRCKDDFETGFATLNAEGDWEEMDPDFIRKLGSDMKPTFLALMAVTPAKPWEAGYGYEIIWKSREEVYQEIVSRKTKKS